MHETRDQKKSIIASKESYSFIKFYMCYTQCNFKYTRTPNLHFRNLLCSTNLCTNDPLHWPQAGEHCIPFFRQIHLILLRSEEQLRLIN